mmetsp:Transcript_17544/g.29605  ORF Transcript_17544/g.29605 Transcript_17544/m.29605 type:complete len:213 (+) Transcript_17544:741-1379(+)
MKLQDLRIRVDEMENVKVYVSSYFRDDKDSSVYIVDPDTLKIGDMNTDFVVEMCNTTWIYAVPKDTSIASSSFKFSFNVFQAQEYRYEGKYNKISILISGVGGMILIFSVVLYLDGFRTIYHYVQERRIENKLKKEMEDPNRKAMNKSGSNEDNDKKRRGGKRGNNDIDTQKSIDELSDDDLNFIQPGGKVDPAVHEGGNVSRPQSIEAMRR